MLKSLKRLSRSMFEANRCWIQLVIVRAAVSVTPLQTQVAEGGNLEKSLK